MLGGAREHHERRRQSKRGERVSRQVVEVRPHDIAAGHHVGSPPAASATRQRTDVDVGVASERDRVVGREARSSVA